MFYFDPFRLKVRTAFFHDVNASSILAKDRKGNNLTGKIIVSKTIVQGSNPCFLGA